MPDEATILQKTIAVLRKDQLAHLAKMGEWLEENRGSCKGCRWRIGYEFMQCTNPCVMSGSPDP